MNKELLDELRNTHNFDKWCLGRSCTQCPFYENEAECRELYDEAKEIPRDIKYDFYIAAPFFNPDQTTRVELVKAILDSKGLTYFSPKDDTFCTNINDPEERKRIFKEDHEAIRNSSRVIAITDGKDPGTIWEAGYAFANKIPVIYIAFTLGQAQFNLMLAESGVAACRTVEELKAAIDGEEIEYKGNVE